MPKVPKMPKMPVRLGVADMPFNELPIWRRPVSFRGRADSRDDSTSAGFFTAGRRATRRLPRGCA